MSESEMKASRLGIEAQNALKVLNPAVDKIVEQLLQALKMLPVGANDQVLAVHAALTATEKVRSVITSIVANGQLAEHALIQADILKGDQ